MQINEFIPELEKRGWTFEYKVIEQGNDGVITGRKYFDKEHCYAVKIYNDKWGFGFITPNTAETLNVVELIRTALSYAIDGYDEYASILESFITIFTKEELDSFVVV